MTTFRHAVWGLAAILAFTAAPSAFAQAEGAQDLLQQQEKQKQIQAETDEVVRRLTTMLRVMEFYGGKDAQTKVLAEMKDTLAGLSKDQMAEVIRQLEQ